MIRACSATLHHWQAEEGGLRRKGWWRDNKKQGFCANIGQWNDDNSGLINMRARYYEPTSGRFISQDPSNDGHNWFSYCANNPVIGVDRNGRWFWEAFQTIWQTIGPLLDYLGIRFSAAIATSAEALGGAMMFLGNQLMGIGFAISTYAEGLAESESPIAQFGAGVLGKLSARAVAAGLELEALGAYVAALGEEESISGLDLGNPDNPSGTGDSEGPAPPLN